MDAAHIEKCQLLEQAETQLAISQQAQKIYQEKAIKLLEYTGHKNDCDWIEYLQCGRISKLVTEENSCTCRWMDIKGSIEE